MSDLVRKFRYDQAVAQRLDKYLVVCLPEYSRSRLQGLIDDGFVLVDDKPAHKSGQMLASGARIEVRIPPPEPSDLIPEEIPLEIIFENDDLLVVNKPAGMVVHPAAGHASGTLVHATLAHVPEILGVGGEKRPGVVHRLDKNTSGLILLAKNDHAHRFLQNQFRLRKTKKVYLALVDGHPPTPSGRIEAPIGRSQVQRKLMAITSPEKGREAISEYLTLETFQDHSLLEVRPLTGRTHQIRLHMAFLGCPITGDTIYGHRHATVPLDRHFLHAIRLTIQIPKDSEPRTFEAPLPKELLNILEMLRKEKWIG